MGRRDYYDDPHAPAANSLVPAASTVVIDAEGRILLQRRRDNDMWALPGGKMELGESLGDCARRETLEETGLEIELTGIVGIYSDPKHVFSYDDGEVRQEFSICFSARRVGGQLIPSHQAPEVAFFKPRSLEALQMVDAIRLRITYFLGGETPRLR